MTRADELARSAGRLIEGAKLAVRAFTPIDTNRVPAEWRHITKVDPEDEKQLPLLFPLYLRHTSAISVGGSSDVTADNTAETFELLYRLSVPSFHEPSGPRHVTDRTQELAEFLAIPEVLNGDVDSLIGQLGAGAEYIRDELATGLIEEKLPWLPAGPRRRLADFATGWMLTEAVFEAYIIMNTDSAAAREANVGEDDLLSPRVAAQRAMAAEKHLDSDVIYLEYSGTYGGEEAVDILQEVTDAVSWSRVWYGGGLASRENAREILDAGADAVIVGNVFHDAAAEEPAMLERALAALPLDASRDAAREWVDEEVEVAACAAARYLSTIADVDRPEEVAADYLAATIDARLALERLAGEIDAGSRAGIERAVDDRPPASLPGARQLERAMGTEGIDLAREYALTFIADANDVEYDSHLPLSHVSVF